jgi:hypothetical protein
MKSVVRLFMRKIKLVAAPWIHIYRIRKITRASGPKIIAVGFVIARQKNCCGSNIMFTNSQPIWEGSHNNQLSQAESLQYSILLFLQQLTVTRREFTVLLPICCQVLNWTGQRNATPPIAECADWHPITALWRTSVLQFMCDWWKVMMGFCLSVTGLFVGAIANISNTEMHFRCGPLCSSCFFPPQKS